jgi:hypothetical protein
VEILNCRGLELAPQYSPVGHTALCQPTTLTQQLMADLFQTAKQNIGQHLKNIFSEGELFEDSVVKKFFTTAADEKSTRQIFIIWMSLFQ